jgi:type I restriction enzyme S subunit
VLFQRSSEIREESGQSNIYLDKNQDATFGGFVIRGRPKVKFNPIYFNYLLKTGSVRKEVTDRSGGSTRFNIGQDSLSQVPILICNSIAEQEKIAIFLGAVDTRISQLRRKHELLQTYKRGVMQKIFSQQIRFKCDDGKPFPDWEHKLAKHIFKSHSDKSHNGDLPILAATQEQGMVFRDNLDLRISSSESSIKSYKVVEKGDFVITDVTWNKDCPHPPAPSPREERGSKIQKILFPSPFGRGARGEGLRSFHVTSVISLRSFQGGIEYSEYHGICSPAYTILKPKVAIVDYFYKQYFKKEDFITQLSNIVVGIRDGKQISYDAFSGLKLPLPCLEEQEKIVGFLTAIDKKIEAVAKQIDLTEQFKKGLLQKMFV